MFEFAMAHPILTTIIVVFTLGIAHDIITGVAQYIALGIAARKRKGSE